jgi:hypothetical protein
MRWRGFAGGSIVGDAKQLIVKPISAQDANRIVRKLHYSGKVVNNSQVHLGVFLDGKCGGAMQFGPSLDKRKMLGLVRGTLWNEFLELNRMAFADWLPRNGESRCIGYAFRWLKKTYPWLKWVVSFADGTQCGDGTIYRASGFVLTGIKKNSEIWEMLTGERVASSSIRPGIGSISHAKTTRGGSSMAAFKNNGAKQLTGFQLRYIYFLDPTARERLTVPILPFSEIDKRGAGMYRGKPRTLRAGSIASDVSAIHAEEGGSTPTPALQLDKQPATVNAKA